MSADQAIGELLKMEANNSVSIRDGGWQRMVPMGTLRVPDESEYKCCFRL